MKLYAKLSGPPPCGVCKSTEHGHVQLAPYEIACPLAVDLTSISNIVALRRDEHGELKAVVGDHEDATGILKREANGGFSIEGSTKLFGGTVEVEVKKP